MQRFFFNILSADLERSTSFYVNLLDMKIHFDSDWFVILKPQSEAPYELGIIDSTHEVAPAKAAGTPQGVYPTFVVDDVEEMFSRAKKLDAEIIEPPTDMFYGQRRMLVRDPDGLILDISSLI